MVTTMKLKQDYTRTTSAGKARGKVKDANIIFRETPGKVAVSHSACPHLGMKYRFAVCRVLEAEFELPVVSLWSDLTLA